MYFLFVFQAEDGIRDRTVTGVQTCALPILAHGATRPHRRDDEARHEGPRGRLPEQDRSAGAARGAHHDRRQDHRAALMHPASGAAWLVWLETTAAADAMRDSLWLYPLVEILHIIGFV